MIEDKALHEFGGGRKVLGVNQDVIGKIEFFEDGNAAQEVRLEKKAIVGLALHDVADPDQLRILSHNLQLRSNVRGPQVGPANHAENRRRPLSQPEKPAGFFHCLARLNGNRSLEVVRFQFGLQILWQKIAAQCGHRIIDPIIFGRVVSPKVLVSVYVHGSQGRTILGETSRSVQARGIGEYSGDAHPSSPRICGILSAGRNFPGQTSILENCLIGGSLRCRNRSATPEQVA
jgi:hypothetical protein